MICIILKVNLLKKRVGIIRHIEGASLRIDCSKHTHGETKCKLHIDIPAGAGNIFIVEAVLAKWLVAGLSIADRASHHDLGKKIHKDFKKSYRK